MVTGFRHAEWSKRKRMDTAMCPTHSHFSSISLATQVGPIWGGKGLKRGMKTGKSLGAILEAPLPHTSFYVWGEHEEKIKIPLRATFIKCSVAQAGAEPRQFWISALCVSFGTLKSHFTDGKYHLRSIAILVHPNPKLMLLPQGET